MRWKIQIEFTWLGRMCHWVQCDPCKYIQNWIIRHNVQDPIDANFEGKTRLHFRVQKFSFHLLGFHEISRFSAKHLQTARYSPVVGFVSNQFEEKSYKQPLSSNYTFKRCKSLCRSKNHLIKVQIGIHSDNSYLEAWANANVFSNNCMRI